MTTLENLRGDLYGTSSRQYETKSKGGRGNRSPKEPKPKSGRPRTQPPTTLSRWSRYTRPDEVSEACWLLAQNFIESGEQIHQDSMPINVENFSKTLNGRINRNHPDNPLRVREVPAPTAEEENPQAKWLWIRLPKGISISQFLTRMVEVFWGHKGAIQDRIVHDRFTDQFVFLESFEVLIEEARKSFHVEQIHAQQANGTLEVRGSGSASEWIQEGLELRKRQKDFWAEHDAEVDKMEVTEIDFAQIEQYRKDRAHETSAKIFDLLATAKKKGRTPRVYQPN